MAWVDDWVLCCHDLVSGFHGPCVDELGCRCLGSGNCPRFTLSTVGHGKER